MAMIDEPGIKVRKTLEVDAAIGDVVADQRGVERKVREITISEDGSVKYKLEDGHSLAVASENSSEVTFECVYCKRRIAFALPGRGTPEVLGRRGSWEPPADFAKWMDPCST